MRRILTSAGLALWLATLSATRGAAQEQPQATIIQLSQPDDEQPGWWRMQVPSAVTVWDVRLGDGCDAIQPGPATLVIDSIGVQWVVLPEDTPGQCRIQEAAAVGQD
jgi:hypothetical protein